MASLQELKLANTKLGDEPSFDEIPAERGSFVPPPQPGSFRFALPKVINNFESITTEKYGERISVVFDAASPLVIVQSPASKYNGDSYETRLNNIPRPRGKEKVLVADTSYLLKALGVEKRPTTNLETAKAIQSLAGKDFGADIEWSWGCGKRRAARFLNPEDGSLYTAEDAESVLDGDDAGLKAGCGKYTYQGDVQKVEGEYPLTISCPECSAQVRAFANLRNFKP